MEYRWDEGEAARLGDELAALVYLSNLVGRDPTLTQPGGGNSSVKRREVDHVGRAVDVLRVKGSGTDLATIAPPGFTGLRLGELGELGRRERMTDEEMMAFMRACMLDGREPAPSVETPLHSVLPFRFVVHTHDFATQALTDTPRPEALVREALADDAVYIDYVRPGFPLARAVSALGAPAAGARGLVLGRHGLVAWGDTAKACYDNLHHLIERAERFVAARRASRAVAFAGEPAAPASAERRRARARELLPALRAALGRAAAPAPAPAPADAFAVPYPILHLDDSPEALAFAGAPRAAELAARGMSTPEHILRCGRLPVVVAGDLAALPAPDAARAVDDALARFAADAAAVHARETARGAAGLVLDPAPRVAVLGGLGVVTAMKDKASALVGNRCYRHVLRVMEAAEALGGFRFLDDADATLFESWPLERRKLGAPERELARQVALVTGAASGIGRAIAARLAAEGAHVVLTDVDADALAAAADALGAACGDRARVRAIPADATRAADAADAVTAAVLAFGGLDILVCNAGFVEPGAIDRISEDSFTRHFAVNVGGTFLAVREAVAVMKAQRRGVILFNASKGAFAPTADNAAYASSKAAVAALGRNLATELGPHGIRVNYVNADFVDTPLMQKLIAERAAIAGVTVDAQVAAYRARNLLSVGPIPPAAVAEAALFLCSPRARFTTGAVITVDGGIKEAMPR